MFLVILKIIVVGKWKRREWRKEECEREAKVGGGTQETCKRMHLNTRIIYGFIVSMG